MQTSTEKVTEERLDFKATPEQIARATSRMSSGLFVKETLDGSSDAAYHAFLKEADDMFQRTRPDYIGLAPCGSRFKGYGYEESDFDVAVVAGEMTYLCEDGLNVQVKEIAKKYGKDANIPFHYNESFFASNFNLELDYHYIYSHAVWPILFPYIGRQDKLHRLREMARKKHQKHLRHSPSTAEKNFHDCIESALFWEFDFHVEVDKHGVKSIRVRKHDGEKIRSRGFSVREIREIIVAREKLWRKRTIKFLMG